MARKPLRSRGGLSVKVSPNGIIIIILYKRINIIMANLEASRVNTWLTKVIVLIKEHSNEDMLRHNVLTLTWSMLQP